MAKQPPKQVSNSLWTEKFQKMTKGAFNKSKTKTPVAKGAKLPGGIVGGVATIEKFYQKCDDNIPSCHLSAVVLLPEEYKGVKFNKSYFFNDMKDGNGKVIKTSSERVDDFTNDLLLLGAEIEDITEAEIKNALTSLQENETCFEFNTVAWEMNKKQGVSIYIQKVTEKPDDEEIEYEEDEEETQEDDDEPEAEEEEEPEDSEEDEERDEEEESEEDEEESEDDEEEYIPAKGDKCNYTFPGAKKPVQCEIVRVNTRASTVNLKAVKGDKKADNVPFGELT